MPCFLPVLLSYVLFMAKADGEIDVHEYLESVSDLVRGLYELRISENHENTRI